MSTNIIYTLSNSSMKIYPNNTRTKFTNKLYKQIEVTRQGYDSLWMSLESITFENTIIQYKGDTSYDIICFPFDIERYAFPYKYFENLNSFADFIHLKTVGKFFKNIYLENGYFNLQTLQIRTLISPRLYHFLGFSNPNNVAIEEWYDNEKYYIIGKYGIENHLKADHKFDIHLYKPNLIKILTTNIEPYFSGGGYENILSIIPFENQCHTTIFIPSLPKQFKVNTNILTNISVELVDENNKPIYFAAGSPSILKIRIKEMDKFFKNFYIQASDIDSKNIYNENNHSSFKSKLPKEINLNGKWSVALTNIYLPGKIQNITYAMTQLEIEAYSNIYFDNNLHTPKQIFHASIPECRCFSLSHLVTLLNDSLKDIPIMFTDQGDGRLGVHGDSWGETLYNIKLHKKLAGLFGMKKQKLTDDDEGEYIIIPLLILKDRSSSPYKYSNIVNPEYTLQPSYWFEDKPNFNFSIPPWIFLYCSIVSLTAVGHSSIPLLKIIPIENDSLHQGRFLEFQTLEYFPLESNCIQTIHFELRSHDNDLAGFDEGNIQLTLPLSKDIIS